MDLRHIRAFIAVADALSVTKAAERLHISQPPLSRHIHQLEHELGLTLFVRHRHGVTLTEAGRWLLDKARTLDAAAYDFYEAANGLATGEVKRIRVGIGYGLWNAANAVRVEFAKQYPSVTIEARDALCPEQCTELLRDHTLDVAIGRPPFDNTLFDTTTLYKERIQVALSADSPLAAKRSVTIRDLANDTLLLWERHHQPMLYDKILDLYRAAGVNVKMTPTPDAGPFNNAGVMLVASGKGVYLCLGVPQSGPQPAAGVAVLPVSDPDATIDVCIASRKRENSPVVGHFLASVERVFRTGAIAWPA
jgi:DNA-binding transcriptional LysR family regulator